MGKTLEQLDQVAEQAEMLEGKTAQEVFAWAVEHYPHLTLACSFGAEDVVLVDMLLNIHPQADIFYLDTDLHFKETYETRDRIAEKYGFTFTRVHSGLSLQQQAEQFGEELWGSDPNLCCQLRKVDPLTEQLKKFDAWVTGVRREQAATRANAKKIEFDAKFGLVKFNPLADWTWKDVWHYIRGNELIYNPLHDQYYPSIGCEKCTRQVMPGEDPRAGRWAGTNKTECGLHLK